MNLLTLDICPVTGRGGIVKYQSVRDYFFKAEGEWTLFVDPASGHLWLNPRPTDGDIPGLYEVYYTHREGFEVTPVWANAIAIARSRRLGYEAPSASSLAARIIARMPTVSAAGAMDMLKIPAAQRGKMLDFGCGNGEFMARMHGHGWEVVGVEPDPKAVAHLKRRYGFDARPSLQDCEDLAGSFDLIILNHVIEHLPDPVEILAGCKKLMKPSARVIVVTPNAQSLGHRVFGRFWRGLEVPRHLNIFTATSLRQAFQAAGLEIQTLTSETRLARGLFSVSLLARRGHECIEINLKVGNVTRLASFAFQVIEGLLVALDSRLGEELYCAGKLLPNWNGRN